MRLVMGKSLPSLRTVFAQQHSKGNQVSFGAADQRHSSMDT